ncbi:Uncharacterized protein LOK49_LG12G01091 [Camellia lanceoleosa]|uniref:Uncharacterized protein n=1 Tax=Camellia lanceoleosa TaxID=1840588 RepID=A0ACC0FTS5_9ERIC|nr:Uncharacterized protein LOK49_LG12G01091 [Camellia lanceoleosa]
MSSPAILFVVLILLISLSTSSATGDDTPTACQVPQRSDFLVSLSTSSATGDDTLTAYQVLEQYDFPVGILPIGAKGYELDKSTGKFKAYLDETCTFTIQNYELKYKSTITGVISKGKLKNLKGVSVKILFLWLNIGEVIRDDDELEFSVGIASADFPIESFVESPQCGCGFDCVNGGEKKRPKFDFISFISALL